MQLCNQQNNLSYFVLFWIPSQETLSTALNFNNENTKFFPSFYSVWDNAGKW